MFNRQFDKYSEIYSVKIIPAPSTPVAKAYKQRLQVRTMVMLMLMPMLMLMLMLMLKVMVKCAPANAVPLPQASAERGSSVRQFANP